MTFFFAAPFLLVKLGSKPPDFVLWILTFLPIVWLVIGIVFGVSGFKQSKAVGRWFYSILAIVLFLLIADSFLGVSRGIQNRNRKNVYAQIYQGAPEGRIHLSLRSWDEATAFNNAVKDFAVSNNISECRNVIYMGYSGPPRCSFKGEHVAIWSGAGSTGIGKFDAHLRIAPFNQKYPVENFKDLFDSLTNSLQATFPNRVEVDFKAASQN